MRRLRDDDLGFLREHDPGLYMQMLRGRIVVDGDNSAMANRARIRWLQENCGGFWHYQTEDVTRRSFLMFEKTADRVAFALRFAGVEI